MTHCPPVCDPLGSLLRKFSDSTTIYSRIPGLCKTSCNHLYLVISCINCESVHSISWRYWGPVIYCKEDKIYLNRHNWYSCTLMSLIREMWTLKMMFSFRVFRPQFISWLDTLLHLFYAAGQLLSMKWCTICSDTDILHLFDKISCNKILCNAVIVLNINALKFPFFGSLQG